MVLLITAPEARLAIRNGCFSVAALEANRLLPMAREDLRLARAC